MGLNYNITIRIKQGLNMTLFKKRYASAVALLLLALNSLLANAQTLVFAIDEVPNPISNNTPYGNWAQGWAGTFQNYLSQSFTLPSDTTITEAEMYLQSTSGTRNASMTLRSGGANGSVIAQGQFSVVSVSGWQRAVFTSPVVLSANTEYFFKTRR